MVQERRRLCIPFCRENGFSIKVVRSSSRYPQNLPLLYDEVERTSLSTSAGLLDDMTVITTDGGVGQSCTWVVLMLILLLPYI